jgi:hypothetical protein
VEISAASTAGAQLGEFEEVLLDTFESLFGKIWEAGDQAFNADACLHRADERFRRAH